MLENPERNTMQLDQNETRVLAAMLCDYATIENCLAPDELDIVMKVAVASNFPEDSLNIIRRLHAESVANLEV
jgi:hypothetical protein